MTFSLHLPSRPPQTGRGTQNSHCPRPEMRLKINFGRGWGFIKFFFWLISLSGPWAEHPGISGVCANPAPNAQQCTQKRVTRPRAGEKIKLYTKKETWWNSCGLDVLIYTSQKMSNWTVTLILNYHHPLYCVILYSHHDLAYLKFRIACYATFEHTWGNYFGLLYIFIYII